MNSCEARELLPPGDTHASHRAPGDERAADGQVGGRAPREEDGGPPTVGDRDRLLTSAVVRVLSDLEASAVTAYLYDETAGELVSTAAAVTPLGTGSVERVPVDGVGYASATAFRDDEVFTAYSVHELGSHPELAVFAPFPFTVSSVPVTAGGERFGAIATYWPRMFRRLPDRERAYLERTGARVGEALRELAVRGVSMRPPPVPLVITAETAGAAAPAGRPGDRRSADSTAMTAPLVYHLHKLANQLVGTVRTEDAAAKAVERVVDGFGARAMAITLVEGDRLRVVEAQGCSRSYLRDLDGRPLGRRSPETDAVNERRQTMRGPGDTHRPGDGRDARAGPDGPDAGTASDAPDGSGAGTPGDGYGTTGAEDAPGAGSEPGRLAWTVLPLLAGGHAVGSCSIGFTPERSKVVNQHSVLVALATLLGQTFERTRMYDAKHALAQDLQQALLPRMLPQLPGVLTTSRYRSTGGGIELGGDWYDLISLPDGRIAAIIGDVQGHNISAAVVMGQLRSAVRAYAAEGHAPADVLARTNRLLVELDTDRFATCCCVRLDPRTGVAEIVSAGHHLPLIRFPDGRYPTRHVEIGIPMGIERDVRYRATRITLEPGTLLGLYTGGLLGRDERTVRSGFGDAVRESGGELETLGDLMIDRVAERGSRTDDAALLLMRYEGTSAQARLHVRRLAIHRRDLRGVRRARQFLREWLRGMELSGLSEEAELLTSEVITNALVHGDTDVDIRVRRYPGRVRVEVRDSDPRHLALPTPVALRDDESEGGRGLLIVSALASAWGNSPSGRGKTVWFELPTETSSPVAERSERPEPAGEPRPPPPTEPAGGPRSSAPA